MNRKTLLIFIVVLAIAGIHISFYWLIVDDAFISFRYAKNLARGGGLVFNKGERVEGFTNLLWILIHAFFAYLRFDIVPLSKYLGLLFSLLTLYLTFQFNHKFLKLSPSEAVLTPLYLALHPTFAMWTTGGLETSMFTFLLFSLFYYTVRIESENINTAKAIVFSSLYILTSLTRPEGLPFGFILLTWLGYKILFVKKKGGRQLLLTVATALAGILLWFLWRYLYYGSLLPNHYNIKINAPVFMLPKGLLYTSGFILSTGWYIILFVVIGTILNKSSRLKRLIGALLFFQMCFVSWIGGDFMGKFRFYMPILPLFALLIPNSLSGWKRMFTRKNNILASKWRYMHTIIAVLILTRTFIPSIFGDPYQPYYTIDIRLQQILTKERKEVGEILKETLPDDMVVALCPAGAIPYYSDLRILDMYGLTDRDIASSPGVQPKDVSPGHTIYNPDLILSKRPDILLGNGRLSEHIGDLSFVSDYFEQVLYDPRRLLKLYTPVYLQVGNMYLNILCLKSRRYSLPPIWKTPESIFF